MGCACRRALELVYALVNEGNIKALTRELLDYLQASAPALLRGLPSVLPVQQLAVGPLDIELAFCRSIIKHFYGSVQALERRCRWQTRSSSRT